MGTDLDESEVKVKVAQSCPTLCDPREYTVHGILQARILEWVAFAFSRVVVKFLFIHLLYLFPPSLFLFSLSLPSSFPSFLSPFQKPFSKEIVFTSPVCKTDENGATHVQREGWNLTDLATPVFSIWYQRHFQETSWNFPATRNKFTSQLELDSFQDLTQNWEKKNHFLLKMKTPRSTRVKWLVQSHTESARTRARTQS